MNYVTPGDGARARVARRARPRAAAHLPDVVAATRAIDKALRLIRVHAQGRAGRDRPRGRLLRPHRRDVPLAVGSRRCIAAARVTSRGRACRIRRVAGTAATIAALRAAVDGGRRPGQGARLRLRARAGAHRRTSCRADFVDRARRAAQGARPAADRGRDHDAHVSLGPRRRSCRRRSGLIPDVLAWWGGGQTGYLHTSRALVHRARR